MKTIKTINTELCKLAVISMDENEPQVINEVMQNESFFTLPLGCLIRDINDNVSNTVREEHGIESIESSLAFNALRNMVYVDCENYIFYIPVNHTVCNFIINELHEIYFTSHEDCLSAIELKNKPIAKNIIRCLKDVRWDARYDRLKK